MKFGCFQIFHKVNLFLTDFYPDIDKLNFCLTLIGPVSSNHFKFLPVQFYSCKKFIYLPNTFSVLFSLLFPVHFDHNEESHSDEKSPCHLTTIGGPWYFWKGICVSKAHKPVTLSGNPTFTKV